MSPSAAIFLCGFACGVVALFLFLLAYRARSPRRVREPSDPGELIMAISADIQAQLDRLAQVPAQINAAEQAAVNAALTVASQNHADDVAALTSATDAIVAAVTPAPPQG